MYEWEYDYFPDEVVPEEPVKVPQLGERGWNDDPAWLRYIERFEYTIEAITKKYTQDRPLREDCAQEARLALMSVFPDQVEGYALYTNGGYSEDEWNRNLDRYCRNVVRNAILSYLTAWKSGPWYMGRSRKDEEGATSHTLPRYIQLDTLVASGLVQIDETGTILYPNRAHAARFGRVWDLYDWTNFDQGGYGQEEA